MSTIFAAIAAVFHFIAHIVATAYEAVTSFVPGGVVVVPAAAVAACVAVVVIELRAGRKA